MTAAALRRWCLSRPGVTEQFPFTASTSVFKVAGKMFALSYHLVVAGLPRKARELLQD